MKHKTFLWASILFFVLMTAPLTAHGLLPGKSVASTRASIAFARAFGKTLSCESGSKPRVKMSIKPSEYLTVVRNIEAYVSRRFVYTAESKGKDEWKDYSEILLRNLNKTFKGDCEDLAITIMAIAVCQGVPMQKLGLALVQTGGGPLSIANVDHVVGLVRSSDGRLYVFGDTRKKKNLSRTDQIFATITADGLTKTYPRWRVLVSESELRRDGAMAFEGKTSRRFSVSNANSSNPFQEQKR